MNTPEQNEIRQQAGRYAGPNNLGIFAKYWEPGQAKTRLAKDIGDQNAADLYYQMLLTLLQRLEAPDSLESQITLYFSPPERENEFRQLPGQQSLLPQPSGGLGERSRHYFAHSFDQSSSGRAKTVIIGSDCPHISLRQIQLAYQLLDQHPMVIGPAEDGGYYLLGLTRAADFLFEDIKWSSSVVLEQTLEKAKQHNLSYAKLQPNYDLDTLQELKRFRDQHLNGDSISLSNLAREIDQIVKRTEPSHLA